MTVGERERLEKWAEVTAANAARYAIEHIDKFRAWYVARNGEEAWEQWMTTYFADYLRSCV